MAKNKWAYWTKVGFHLFVLSIIPMIAGSIAGYLLSFAIKGILLTAAEFVIGFTLIGYFVVRYRKWLFKDKVV
jgi:uncharacterized membrane protein YoaK (UPF0700 family)